MPSVNLTDINKNTLKNSFIGAIKTIFIFFGKQIIMRGLLDGWDLERLFLISVINPGREQDCSEDRDKLVDVSEQLDNK